MILKVDKTASKNVMESILAILEIKRVREITIDQCDAAGVDKT